MRSAATSQSTRCSTTSTREWWRISQSSE
jgi:hypothetical protein